MHNEAKAKYEAYLAQHPDDADICHAYGVLLGQTQAFSLAKKTLEKAIALKSNQASYYNSLGNVLNHMGNVDQAIKHYQKAIKIQPKYPASYNNLGRIYITQGKYQSAETALAKAVRFNPNFADAHCNLGILYVLLTQDNKAKTHLETAIRINPNLLTALRQLSDIYIRQEQFQEAIELLLRCLKQVNDNADDYHQLGIAFYKEKDFEQAAAAFKKVLSIHSKHPEANQYLANSILALGDHEKALNYYFHQLSNEPTMEAYYNIGSILMAKDRLQDARSYLLEAEKLAPDDLATQLNLGSLFLKGQDISSAIKHYKNAASINPGDAEIQHILSALTQNKLPEKAPSTYLQHLFDHYAIYYDKHLTTCLDYDVPQKMHTIISQEIALEDKQWHILDLGCGTGLSGVSFKPYANTLIGVDASEKMLHIAKEKAIYDDLIQGDIEDYIVKAPKKDLVLAADVFTYIGDLSHIFEHTHNRLNPAGVFAFSIEKTFEDKFVLQQSIRYAHNRQYIRALIQKYGFKELRFDNAILRKQQNKPVEGYLVVLQK